MNALPLVTIVSVVYQIINSGRKETFLQMVESVKNQDYPNIEHLIIDGGSYDGTVELLKELDLNYNSEADNGIYDAMNKGISIANGKYIAFLNSDDYYHNSKALSSCVKQLEEDNLDFIGGNVAYITEYNTVENYIFYADYSKLFHYMPVGHPAFLCKAEILRISPFDLQYKFLADYDLLFRLLLNGYRGAVIPFTFVTYRTGGASCSSLAYDEQSKIQEKYLPHKEEILKNLPKEFANVFPTISIITICDSKSYNNSNILLDKCIQSVQEQSYKNIEHLVVEQGNKTFNQSLKNAIIECMGDYIYILSSSSVLSDASIIEKLMMLLLDERAYAIYSDINLNSPIGVENINFGKLWRREKFLIENLPYQCIMYKKELLMQFVEDKKAVFNEFILHNELFLKEGFTYAYSHKIIAHIPKDEVRIYSKNEKQGFAKSYKQYIGKVSPYEAIFKSKSFKIKSFLMFKHITIMKTKENMWMKKYLFLGFFPITIYKI